MLNATQEAGRLSQQPLVDVLSSAVKELEVIANEAVVLADTLAGAVPTPVNKKGGRISGPSVFDCIRADAARVREFVHTIETSIGRIRGAL